MLILTRRIGESINIGDDINVIILGFNERYPNQIRIGIEAPRNVQILRPNSISKEKKQ